MNDESFQYINNLEFNGMPRPEYQNNRHVQNSSMYPPSYPINTAPMPYPVHSAPIILGATVNQSSNNEANSTMLPYPTLEMMPDNHKAVETEPPIYSVAIKKTAEENSPFLNKN